MPHIGSSILQIDQACHGFLHPPWYMIPECHTYDFDKCLVVILSRVNVLNNYVNVCCVSTAVFLSRVKSFSECSRSRHKHMVYSDTHGAMLSTVIWFRTDFTRTLSMLEDEKMRSGM